MLSKQEHALIAYATTYYTGDEAFDRNIRLKLSHSFRVRDIARRILDEESSIPSRDRELILRAALFHDCGRFEQFKRSGTYSDSASHCDHGKLSAETALEHGFIADFPPEERRLIFQAILVHNRLAIPETFSERERRAAAVVRDADKCDIMTILLEHLRAPQKNPVIVFSLDSAPVLTPRVADALQNHRSPFHGDMRTQLDFLAAKFSWVYDLNFSASRRFWLDRGFLDELHRLLPSLPEIDRFYFEALQFLKH